MYQELDPFIKNQGTVVVEQIGAVHGHDRMRDLSLDYTQVKQGILLTNRTNCACDSPVSSRDVLYSQTILPGNLCI